MPYNQVPTEYVGWYHRYTNRTVYSHFIDAGIDTFSSGPNQNPQAFLDLNNLLPGVSGGFRTRWGVYNLSALSGAAYPAAGTPSQVFFYNVPQDASNPSGTSATNIFLYRNINLLEVLNDDGSAYSRSGLTIAPSDFQTSFGANGNIYAVTSRFWNYLTVGLGTAVKINWGLNSSPGFNTPQGPNLWGIVAPLPALDAAGNQTNLITVTPNGTGPLTFATGRQYTVAFMNSFTGHVSDIWYSFNPPVPSLSKAAWQPAATYILGQIVNDGIYNQKVTTAGTSGTSVPTWNETVGGTTTDGTVTWTNQNSGFTSLTVNISISDIVGSAAPVVNTGNNRPIKRYTANAVIDGQVDTVLLLATSDGGDEQHLYLVAKIPLSSFAPAVVVPNTNLTFTYTDTMPDTYSQTYTSGATLLTQNLYVDTDEFGNVLGIADNLPPQEPFTYPTVHVGRIFVTDGVNVYFSKSIDEVTTSTGLITAKWEEAFPGANQIPIATDNERVTALQSNGQVLHIATTRAVYTLYGTDMASFSIPDQQFAQTGVLNQDVWNVIYKESQPSAYMWITPDYKVMFSDFNTYEDVGVPVYSYLQQWDLTFTGAAVKSFTYGPYNFAVVFFRRVGQTYPELLIFETTLRKWYHWTFPIGVPQGGVVDYHGPTSIFFYQYPSSGNRFLFYTEFCDTSLLTWYFNPTQTKDFTNVPAPGGTPIFQNNNLSIPWNVRTTWQDMGDATVWKVLNEMEAIGDENAMVATVYGAVTQADFDSPYTIKTGSFTTAPFGGARKFYLAGANSRARFYSFQIGAPSPSATSADVLTSFITDYSPISRI